MQRFENLSKCDFWELFHYFIQHCFFCRLSESLLSDDLTTRLDLIHRYILPVLLFLTCFLLVLFFFIFSELLGPGVHITVMVYNFNAYFKEDANAKVGTCFKFCSVQIMGDFRICIVRILSSTETFWSFRNR
jgi:hypothetical protein